MEETRLEHLPQDCISHILSFTCPRDVRHSSLVSSGIWDACESDALWENFLPSNYKEIISRLVSPMVFTSKKELFHKLCSPLLVDGGKKTFSIDKFTNKKCYMLSARELCITWSSNPFYWCWKPLRESRFAKVVELVMVCWLEIHGTMNTRMLSPNTYYGAYLVVKFLNRAYGLDVLPTELLIEVGDYQSCGTIYLRHTRSSTKSYKCICGTNGVETLRSSATKGEDRAIRERGDGWTEVELGEFYCDGSEKEVRMGLREIKGEHLKGGLVVEGIELWPKYKYYNMIFLVVKSNLDSQRIII